MITAGIDIGLENIKVVIFDGTAVLARATGRSGGAGRGAAAQALYEQALKDAGLGADSVENIVATGQGKYDASCASATVTEPIAAAAAAGYFSPGARFVMDAGADQVRVAPLKEGGKLGQLAFNQKCSAGLGTLIRWLAHRLDMSVQEVSALGEDDAGGTVVNDGCIVFAELDAIEALCAGAPREQVAAAVNIAVGYRLHAILNDKETPEKGDIVVLIGGLSQNKAVTDALKKRSIAEFAIPDDALYGCAIGAAIKAAG